MTTQESVTKPKGFNTQDFVNWMSTQTPEGGYDPDSPHNCPIAQYVRALGYTFNCEESRHQDLENYLYLKLLDSSEHYHNIIYGFEDWMGLWPNVYTWARALNRAARYGFIPQ